MFFAQFVPALATFDDIKTNEDKYASHRNSLDLISPVTGSLSDVANDEAKDCLELQLEPVLRLRTQMREENRFLSRSPRGEIFP